LRRANALRVFLAGLVIAGIVIIPILNLITPVFATAFMVRMHKKISRESLARPELAARIAD
jgi:CysZ protein